MTKKLRFRGRGGYAATTGAIVDAIANEVEFRAGNMRGEVTIDSWPGDAGRAEGATREVYNLDADAGRIVYVVRSYATPIAWLTWQREWIVPDDTYSVTTSRHQGIVRRALRGEETWRPGAAGNAIVRNVRLPR